MMLDTPTKETQSSPVIDVAALVADVEATVARRRAAGEYPMELLNRLHAEFADADDDPPEILVEITTARLLKSKRSVFGPVVIFAKRVVRRLLAWYINPIAVDQTRFNAAILRDLRKLERRVARLEVPWNPPVAAPEREVATAKIVDGLDARRATAYAPYIGSAPPESVLIVGSTKLLTTLRQANVDIDSKLAPSPISSNNTAAELTDPILLLERVPAESLKLLILADVLPFVSASDLLRAIPLAFESLKGDGVLIIDAPNPQHNNALRDPSDIDPAMLRWISSDTVSLLCDAAGLASKTVPIGDTAGNAPWYAVVARRVT